MPDLIGRGPQARRPRRRGVRLGLHELHAHGPRAEGEVTAAALALPSLFSYSSRYSSFTFLVVTHCNVDFTNLTLETLFYLGLHQLHAHGPRAEGEVLSTSPQPTEQRSKVKGRNCVYGTAWEYDSVEQQLLQRGTHFCFDLPAFHGAQNLGCGARCNVLLSD